MFILRLLMADVYGDKTMDICGDYGGFTDQKTCGVMNPKALIAYKGAIYASSSNSTWSEILKIQGQRFRAHNRSARFNCLGRRRVR